MFVGLMFEDPPELSGVDSGVFQDWNEDGDEGRFCAEGSVVGISGRALCFEEDCPRHHHPAASPLSLRGCLA